MELCKSSAFKLDQSIIKIPLHTVERHLYGLGSSDTEILDIFSPCAVNHRMERMQTLDLSDHLNSFITGDLCSVQERKYLFKLRIMLDNISAPCGSKNIRDLSLACFLPSFLLVPYNPEEIVDERIGFRHGFEGIFINNHIRTKQVQQGIQVIVAVLQRRCRQENYSICVSAEKFHSTISPGIGVSDVMGLIHNDQVKMRKRIQFG